VHVGSCRVFFQTTPRRGAPPLANVANAANAPFQKRIIFYTSKVYSLFFLIFGNFSEYSLSIQRGQKMGILNNL
jgi:hypothetical protein